MDGTLSERGKGSWVREKLDRVSLEWLPLGVTLLATVGFGLMIGSLFLGSFVFRIRETQALTWADVVEVLSNPEIHQIIGNTVFIGIVAGLVSIALGTTYAWIAVRTNVPAKRWLRLMAIMPLTMPGIVKSFGWIAMLSPEIGIINVTARTHLGIEMVFNMYSIWGVIIALGFAGVSGTFLILEAPLRSLASVLEEQSRIAGWGHLRTFRNVTLPLMIPGILSAFFLQSTYAFGNFEYPLLFGAMVGGIETLATEIYFVMTLRQIARYDIASLLSIIYILGALFLIGLYHYFTRMTSRFETVGGKDSHVTPYDLGKWRYFGLGTCLMIWGIAFGIPFMGIFLLSLSPNVGDVPGLTVALSQITISNYWEFLSLTSFVDSLYNTVILAFFGALGVTVLSIFIAYTALKTDYTFSRAADYISVLPRGLPPIVYGLAIFWMVLLVPGLNSTYGTLFPMILAVIFLKIPHGVRLISSNLIQLSDEMEEASRVSGHPWQTGFRRIVLPLNIGGISNTFLYVFVDAMKELAAIILLVAAGNNVFTSFLLGMYANSPGALPKVAAASVMFAGVLAILTVIQGQINEWSYFSTQPGR